MIETALEGLRVIEIGQNVAGPFCSTLLGDFGADVIKVEVPDTGDSLRGMGTVVNNASTWFAVEARNKKSITINLKKEEGKELLKNLIKISDVLVENFKPGVLERLGLGWETLQKINKKLILVRISGFGQSGPYKERYAYNRIGLAMGGLTYFEGFPDRPPLMTPIALSDYLSGMFAALGVMYAIYYRDVRGKDIGQIVDIGLYESVFRLLEGHVAHYDLTGKVRERTGNDHPGSVPGGTFETKDGKFLTIAVANNRVFGRFAECISMPELKEVPRYKTQPERLACITELNSIAGKWILEHTLDECLKVFSGEVPVSRVLSMRDIFEDPQYKARENIVTTHHETLGDIKMQNVVPKLSKTPGKVKWAGPSLGKSNEEVFKELLGLNDNEIEELRKNKII